MRALLIRLLVVLVVGAAFASVGALLTLERRALPAILEQAFAPPGSPATTPAAEPAEDPRDLTHVDPDFSDFSNTTWTLFAAFQIAFFFNVPLAAVGFALKRWTRRRHWQWSGEVRGWFFLLLGVQAACATVCALIGLLAIVAFADESVRTRSFRSVDLILLAVIALPLLLNALLGVRGVAAWRTLSAQSTPTADLEGVRPA